MSQDHPGNSSSEENLFLAKCGLLTLLAGIVLLALGWFLGHAEVAAWFFVAAVVVSTFLSAFSGNNKISTATLSLDIILLGLIALNAIAYFAV